LEPSIEDTPEIPRERGDCLLLWRRQVHQMIIRVSVDSSEFAYGERRATDAVRITQTHKLLRNRAVTDAANECVANMRSASSASSDT
jgi:hypothetical protein